MAVAIGTDEADILSCNSLCMVILLVGRSEDRQVRGRVGILCLAMAEDRTGGDQRLVSAGFQAVLRFKQD